MALSKRYGKLPFGDLFEPAIRYAGDGYAVSPVIAQKWALAAAVMPQGLGWQDHFLIAGRAPAPGERFRSPAMAKTLSMIATTEGEAFYRGALAEAIVAHAQANDSVHARADFERHAVDWVTPIAVDYRGIRVHEIPPNGQGIAALMALGMLESFDLAALPPDSVASLHLQIEAMKLAFADAYRYVADLSSMTISPASLLDRGYLRERASLIDRDRAQNFGPGAPPRGGTVYVAAADAGGMMVSLIQSNYMGFGSGVVVPGTGISLQNRGTGFSLEHDHPNEVAGRKRPFHTDHSRLHDARRRAACNVRCHGRSDPAAWSCADRGAHAGLHYESAGSARCAAVSRERRRLDRSRGERVTRVARGTRGTRSYTRSGARFRTWILAPVR